LESLSTFKQIIDIFSALLSPVIAISVAFIAFQQWKLNANKEKRESNAHKLQIYMDVKRFLRSVDTTRNVDIKLYEELQESLALADFYFDGIVIDWLFEVDCAASCWLDLTQMNSIPNSEEDNPEYGRNAKDIDGLIDELQNFHCQLFDVFKSGMVYLKTNKSLKQDK
jgi:hypothetical protein